MRGRWTPWLFVVIPAAVALAVAGCGGGDGDRLSKEEFLTRANGICKAFRIRQSEVQFPVPNPLQPGLGHAERARWALSLKQVIDIGRQALKSLRKLEPPKELEDEFDRMLGQWSAAYDTLLEGSVAAKENRPVRIREKIPVGREMLDKQTELAKELGLPECG